MTPRDPRVAWFRRLKRCMAAIPDDTLVLVRHGCIELTTPEFREAAFARHGHIDNCETLESFEVKRSTIEPAGEGL